MYAPPRHDKQEQVTLDELIDSDWCNAEPTRLLVAPTRPSLPHVDSTAARAPALTAASAPRLLSLPPLTRDAAPTRRDTTPVPKRPAPARFRMGLVVAALLAIVTTAALLLRGATPVAVRVVAVVRAPLVSRVPTPTAGRVVPESELTLKSESSARVARVLVRAGQRVQAGDALIELDAQQLENALRAAESNHQAAKAAAAEAGLRAEAARTRPATFARSAAAAQARLDEQGAKVEMAKKALEHSIIQAPIAGLVTAVHVSAGENINPGTPLVAVADVSRLHIAAEVDEADAARVREGANVELRFVGEQNMRASIVTRVEPRVVETARGVRVLGFDVELPSGTQPPLGASSEVFLVLARRASAVVLPKGAIHRRDKNSFVYVVLEGEATLRPVQVGLSDSTHVEVIGGVEVGEVVVDSPSLSAELHGNDGPIRVAVSEHAPPEP
jgi:RND family efflux transporter MFP subunit